MEAFLLTCLKNNWIYSRWKSVFRDKFSCRTNTVHHWQNVLNIVNHSKTLRHWVCDIFPWYYVVTDRLHRETLKFLVVFHRRMRLNVDRSLGTHEVLKNSCVYLLNFFVFCTFMMSEPLGFKSCWGWERWQVKYVPHMTPTWDINTRDIIWLAGP